MNPMKPAKPQSASEKTTRTTVDTIMFTSDEAREWKIPPFQRPLRVNDKVRALAQVIGSDGGIIPGILTFGKVKGDVYLIDGQHRRESFLMSEKVEGFADIRMCHFETMAEMGEEFVRLNSQLVRMRPDDMLRGMEESLPVLGKIRHACPFVGYDMIRRFGNSPIVSMSVLLRTWEISKSDIPASCQTSGIMIAQNMSDDEVKSLINFYKALGETWGRDPEYQRLWTALNLAICAWIYRRTVLMRYSSKSVLMTMDQFKKCLMSLSADGNYLEWLVGRHLGDRDRAPCYHRITNIFAKRISQDEEVGKKVQFPRPPWALGRKGK